MSAIYELYLILVLFILPFEYVNFTTIGFSVLSVVIFGFIFIKNRRIAITNESGERNMVIPLVLLTIAYITIVLISPYSYIFTSELYANILCGFIYFYYFRYIGISRLFRIIAFLSVGIQLTLCLINNEVFSLWSISEKSASTAVVFLLMCIEYKYKNRLGTLVYFVELIIISLQKVYGYNDNRTSLLLLLVFVVTICLQWWFSKTGKHEVRNIWLVEKSGRFFIFSVVFIFFFSLLWVRVTQLMGYTGYHQSIFDNSNNVRFISDLYVFQQFFKEPQLLLFGYDQNIFDVMKLGVGQGYLHYMGARVVYAHHSVLSVYQRCGFLFSVFYFIVLARMLDQSRMKIRNEILLPIFAISLIMHSYLQTECLMMLLITLNADYENYTPLFKMNVLKRRN